MLAVARSLSPNNAGARTDRGDADTTQSRDAIDATNTDATGQRDFNATDADATERNGLLGGEALTALLRSLGTDAKPNNPRPTVTVEPSLSELRRRHQLCSRLTLASGSTSVGERGCLCRCNAATAWPQSERQTTKEDYFLDGVKMQLSDVASEPINQAQ